MDDRTPPPQRPPRVVVVGGGISGLAAAHELTRRLPHAEVVVLESADVAGGKLRRAEVGGVTVDVGAESILNRRPEGVALAREVGLGDSVVHPETIEARVWSRDQMCPMPRSVMGIPADLDDLERCAVLSRRGVARVRVEQRLPPTELGDTDVSVGWLVEERLGREVLDRLVEPLLGGVYAGHARELSARATVPQVVGLLDRDRSMVRAAAAQLAERSADEPVFAGLVGGVGRLAETLAAQLDVRTGTTVRELHRTPAGWRLVTGPAPDPAELTADAVVLAVPAAPAARLLADVAPGASTELAAIEHASMAVVTLAFPARDMPPVHGSGFLVPPVDERRIKAATYSFAKWGWVREASDEVVLMRTSVGRHREERDLQVDDEELRDRSVADLSRAIGLSVRPVDWRVTRWGGGLPQYAVGHLDRVRRIRQAVSDVVGLAVCGAAYDGLGIPACIATAQRAAEEVADQVASRQAR